MSLLNHIRLRKCAYCTMFLPLFFLSIFLVEKSWGDEKIPKVIVKLSASEFQDKEEILAINFKNAPHWHTYWKNPGDAGLPIKITMSDGEEVNYLEWPTPKRYIEPGNAWAYGYEDNYSIFIEAPPSSKYPLEVTWLVCKHICIPGKAEIDQDLKVFPESLRSEEEPENELSNRYKKLPKKRTDYLKDLDIVIAKDESKEDTLTLYYNLNRPTGNYLSSYQNLLFPFPNPLLDFKHEELFEDNDGHLYAKMTIEWNGYYMEPEVPFPKNYKLNEPINISFIYSDKEQQTPVIIEKSFNSISNTSEQLKSFYKLLSPLQLEDSDRSIKEGSSKKAASGKKSIFSFLLLAFLGGLILNLMPCVLPVISLKLFSMASLSNESKKEVTSHNLLYSLGVLSTFWILAGLISLLKITGTVVGWGFQLQSPIFLIIMSTGLFIFSLNMFGLFEFSTPGGTKLGSIQTKGKFGDFLNGVLATILSTPCSAPFLGTALAFAFTQGPATIFLIFTFVGLGLAAPFVLTAFIPGLIKVFPKPGEWMNTFKSFLGLSLLLTCFWLLSVLQSLVSEGFIIWALVSFALIFYAFYLQKVSKGKRTLFWILLTMAIGVLYFKYAPKQSMSEKIVSDTKLISKAGMQWEKWTVKKLEDYQSQKLLTFVDFTADWCLTCKVNEKLVIQSTDFQNLIKENKISLLLGDWTNGDQEITDWLLKNDMAGVPAYFFVDRMGTLHNLGETISIKKIQDLL